MLLYLYLFPLLNQLNLSFFKLVEALVLVLFPFVYLADLTVFDTIHNLGSLF